MSSFTTRVVLKGQRTSDERNKLDTAMERAGFLRTISSNDGLTYELPEGEFNLSGQYSRSDVLDLVKDVVEEFGEAAILITESAGRTWNGLKKI